MNYTVKYEKRAIRQLKKIDRAQQKILISWIEKHLLNTSYPKQFGKPLKGELDKYWRYKVGKYRIIAEIDDNFIIIFIISVGHRKDVYK